MTFKPAVRSWRATLVVLLVGLTGCDSPPTQTADPEAGKPTTTVAEKLPQEALPERNIEGMDVCAVLPGAAVAAAVNLPLAHTARGPEGRSCDYTLPRKGSYEAVIHVGLYQTYLFDFTRRSSAKAEKVPGLGADAFTRKRGEIWVARQDGLIVMVAASESDEAEAVARAALATIP